MLNLGQVVNEYTVTEVLKPGDFGYTFKVRNNSSQLDGVMKVTKAATGSAEEIRFRQENAILQRLSPHNRIITPLSDVIDSDPKCVYYVMEMADTDLKGYMLLASQNLDPRAKFKIFADICEGVQHAHANSIIHRDLHWGNILIKNENHIDETKLTDFGKAKDFNLSVISSTMPDWGWYVCPPEVRFPIWDKVPNTYLAGDIYALGLILNFIMVATPQYSQAVVSSIEIYLRSKGIVNLQALDQASRLNLYEDWLNNIDQSVLLSFLSTPTGDAQIDLLVSDMIPKLSHPDYRKRYQNVEEVINDINSI